MQEQYCCASIGPLASHNGVCIHYDCTHLILRSVSGRSLKVVLPSTNLYEKLTSALANFAKVYTPIQPSFVQCIKEAPAQLASPSRTLNCCLPSPQERTPPVPVLCRTLACCFPSPQERTPPTAIFAAMCLCEVVHAAVFAPQEKTLRRLIRRRSVSPVTARGRWHV